MRRLAAGLVLAAACMAGPAAAQGWKPLFDGRSLKGWTPKIAGYPAGDNFADTFRVEDRAIVVSYAGYDRFGNRFGHLFQEAPWAAYRLRLRYKVLETGALPDTPAWARSNSGVMFAAPAPQAMGLGQPFPVSVEFQILGADGPGPRPTGSVCTPGTHVTLADGRAKAHCTISSGPTISNGRWVRLELEVRPDGEVIQRIEGKEVLRYRKVELDPTDPLARDMTDGDPAFPGRWIALQSEGHPIAFRDIEIQPLK